jgi:hypothetical protein
MTGTGIGGAWQPVADVLAANGLVTALVLVATAFGVRPAELVGPVRRGWWRWGSRSPSSSAGWWRWRAATAIRSR